MDLYETDFYSWTNQQADLLRRGDLQRVDLQNVAEEIESLGRSQLSALRSSYKLIAMHLLKLMKQPERASPSWENTINRERSNVSDMLDDNPGMRPKRNELFAKAYASARSDASFETKIDLRMFPAEPPFSLDEVENRAFWPAGFPTAPEKALGRTMPKRSGRGR